MQQQSNFRTDIVEQQPQQHNQQAKVIKQDSCTASQVKDQYKDIKFDS